MLEQPSQEAAKQRIQEAQARPPLPLNQGVQSGLSPGFPLKVAIYRAKTRACVACCLLEAFVFRAWHCRSCNVLCAGPFLHCEKWPLPKAKVDEEAPPHTLSSPLPCESL